MNSIILEGPNGCGKSTLAKLLSEKYGLRIYHATKPASHFEAIELAYGEYHLAKIPAIFDRSHAISRLIYQRDTVGILERELLEVITARSMIQYNIIYCIGHGKRDIDKAHYTPELIKETQDQENIRKRYDRAFHYIKHQKFDFKNDDISSLQLT